MVTYEAFDDRLDYKIISSVASLMRKVNTSYQEVYDENSSGHLFPIRSAQKSGLTVITNNT